MAVFNPNPLDQLFIDGCSHDELWEERFDRARDPNTPAEELVKLANDKSWKVRREVGKNQNTPIQVRYELTYDDHIMVRTSAKTFLYPD